MSFQHLVTMFGSAAELARAIKIHRAAVTRWVNGDRAVPPGQQLKILEAGIARGMDADELAYALDVSRCPCCEHILDDDIRNAVEAAREAA